VVLFFLWRRAWWAQVTEIPLDSNTKVLRRGIWNGFIAWMPAGGHLAPNSKLGARLLWKNIQKKEKKNSTSEVIKRSMPKCSPSITFSGWNPWKDLSRETSRHQFVIIIGSIVVLKIAGTIFFVLI
jgi:hypothetical protein